MIRQLYLNIKVAIKIVSIAICFLLFLIPGVFTFKLHKKTHKKLIKLFFFGAVKIIGLKIEESGHKKLSKQGILYVSNHTSYTDIIVIGSKLSARFTPKIEVAKWPIISFMVNMSLPVYIQRSPSKSLEQKQRIHDIIHSGDSILLFPEGTTNDGSKVLPFKSSLFSVAEPVEKKDSSSPSSNDKKMVIQPISITYTQINGEEIKDAKSMDKIAWYGDMEFFPHFWEILKLRTINVKIIYHDELYFKNFCDRKILAKHCEEVISKGVKKAIFIK